MAWATSRYKTFVSGGSFTPADANAIQDQYVRATGILNDDLDKASVADILGITQSAAASGGAAVRRGFLSIPGLEARTNAAYGLMATPDQIQNVVVPTGGLVIISYHAVWHSLSVSNTASAAIFMGSNQLKAPAGAAGASPFPQEATLGSQMATNQALVSTTNGLATTNGSSGYSPGTTDPLLVGGGVISSCGAGGLTVVHINPGTYTISVQFKTVGGATVHVSNRRLRVWTVGF